MDKLEHYLDQVCRSIGGPKALRQHVRQELREHLLDAVAEHKAAGLSEEAALDKALDEFGKPEEVRGELEATHGHRLLPVVIDKAMQWKELTMKAKWLWTTWAYLAVVLLIALELLFICFNVVFLIPKYEKLSHSRILDPAIDEEMGIGWMRRFLAGLSYTTGHYMAYILLAAAALWGLFEWRVKSENKAFIRLAILGTAAVGLLVVVILTAGSQTVSFYLGVASVGRLARPYAEEQIAQVDTETNAVEQALAKKDWEAMQDHATRAARALDNLSKAAPAIPTLLSWKSPTTTADELRADVQEAGEHLKEALLAIKDKDAERLAAALKKFHKAFEPVQEAAKKSAN
jgi:hypothetical protein